MLRQSNSRLEMHFGKKVIKFIKKRPEVKGAYGYGSGVFKQEGYSEKEHRNAMLDIIIGVDNPESWHKSNIKVNPDHYSSIRFLGSTSISRIEVLHDCIIYKLDKGVSLDFLARLFFIIVDLFCRFFIYIFRTYKCIE